jgi:hypothetical protein
MRNVVREALIHVDKFGLPGEHHFFISFQTNFPGVSISPQLKARYPEEITIVVQHQFWDLKITDKQFSIMLSFNNIPEKLVVPFDALTAFADPSIKFGLQFHGKPVARHRRGRGFRSPARRLGAPATKSRPWPRSRKKPRPKRPKPRMTKKSSASRLSASASGALLTSWLE